MELNQKVEDLERQFQNRSLKEDALNKILQGNEGQLDTQSAKKP
jgi:hypothetical protein